MIVAFVQVIPKFGYDQINVSQRNVLLNIQGLIFIYIILMTSFLISNVRLSSLDFEVL